MLERLVAWVLNNYLGKYVENLNTDQLSVAILQGEVELENLPLKKDALRHVGLPIQIRAGYVGKVKLQIPVPQIRSAPWVILIEQLCVVAGPVKLSEWDEEAEEQAAQEFKLSQLDAMEARWRAEMDTAQPSGYYASSYSGWLSLGTNLVASIVENLQLKIKDVHFRYEDDETVPDQLFAFGVTVDSLTAQSCDDKWMPRFMGRETGDISFKLLELSALSVYCDKLNVDQLFGGLSLGELVVAMSQCISEQHQYVLSPVSAQAHIKRNKSDQPLRSKTQPRIVCDVQLDDVPLSLTDWQYGQVVACIKGLQCIDKNRRHRKFRPYCTVHENPRAWWRYALESLRYSGQVEGWHSGPSCDWKASLQRARDNVSYVALYSRILANPTAALSAADKQLKDALEQERGLEELRSLREVAMRKVQPPEREPNQEAPHSPSGRGMLLQWFPQLWGWGEAATEVAQPSTPGETQSQAEMQLEDEILDALADTVENNTILRRDTVFGQFNLTLRKGAFNLCTESTEGAVPMVVLEFDNMVVGLESRPRSGSHKVHIALGAMFLRDRLTEDTAFPVLVGPQSRDSGCSVLGRGGPLAARSFAPGLARLMSQGENRRPEEPLFKLVYEYKPFNSTVDYRLHVHTRSLEIVYNPAAIKWLVDFFTKPHQAPDSQLRLAARHRYEAMKLRTKRELMRNLEQILEGDLSDRKTWDVEMDISAPQIVFVEHFCDKNALIVVVDFGKFHFSNQPETSVPVTDAGPAGDSDDEDDFQTPCSTPPGSEASLSESTPLQSVAEPGLPPTEDLCSSVTDLALHQRLYDRYTMDLGDLQILVGRVRDNWKYAHMRGTSTLHVLDRFNISLQVERRVVYTNDPRYPSLTFSGNLPKLVVHVNEQKIDALRTMATLMTDKGLPSPFRSQEPTGEQFEEISADVDASSRSESVERSEREMTRLLMLQFTFDHMSLEVQSRGRSIAELQVSGVRASFTKRPYDTSMSLSVHSLLLVDALQTFGPDFELLVASHKHVGMDSVSGSLRDSEPTSPTSPASPDPTGPKAAKATSPVALTQALSSLQGDTGLHHRAKSPTNFSASPPHPMSPPPGQFTFGKPPSIALDVLDSEALIMIDLHLVNANCPSNEGNAESLQIATIQFNNLDIIANQETIVELVGFIRRVFPPSRQTRHIHFPLDSPVASSVVGDTSLASPLAERDEAASLGQLASPITRTELTFDFHRLNVLLLRAVVKDSTVVGRKIGTATLSEAKIQATVGRSLVVHGSLGGIQVLDLTPEGQRHQRILSLGKDPLVERNRIDLLNCLNAELYTMGHQTSYLPEDGHAFSFSVQRGMGKSEPADLAEIKVRMASVWYTHSPQFVHELQSCATEFKQYLANLARSIKSAATEMAIGLVHARTEALTQGLYRTRLSSSLTGSSAWEMSPRRRRRSSLSQSCEQLDPTTSTRGTTPHTPISPSVDEESLDLLADIRLDVVLDTPVVVLPRSPTSHQVFVAHLGKISLNNSRVITPEDEPWGQVVHREHYDIEIRDMNLFSLDTERRPGNKNSATHLQALSEPTLPRAEELYNCANGGQPLLHDTVLQLVVEREAGHVQTLCWLPGEESTEREVQDVVHVRGSVVAPLRVSLSRQQYEQLLDTLDGLLATRAPPEPPPPPERHLGDIREEDTGVTTLDMDQTLRTKMMTVGVTSQQDNTHHHLTLLVDFDLPEFCVELQGDLGGGEQGLVDLSFRDFSVCYEKSHRYKTNIQVSLRSLLMEDLLRPVDSKHRRIVVSSVAERKRGPVSSQVFVSKSCPNLMGHQPLYTRGGSLPDHLETNGVYQKYPGSKRSQTEQSAHHSKTVEYPCTPPPSPRQQGSSRKIHHEDNLVHINVVLVDPDAPNFASVHNSVHRSVMVDFNSLDVVVNVESWVVILDFFGIGSSRVASDGGNHVLRQPTTSAGSAVSQGVSEVRAFDSELELEVRSLTLVLNRPEHEVARANVSQLSARVSNCKGQQSIDGRLGSMSLSDLTRRGQLYRDKFVTSGCEALNFHMLRTYQHSISNQLIYDTHLKLEMSSVLYVHTRRFVAEIQEFCSHFSRLQAVVNKIREATSGNLEPEENTRGSRLLLEIHAGSPVIMLPVSSQSSELLVVDLGKLTVSNSFKVAGSEGTISCPRPETSQTGSEFVNGEIKNQSPTMPHPCMLDVMLIELQNMDLYAGHREARGSAPGALDMGTFCVRKQGPSLLQEKCQLNLQVERNLDTHVCHSVPDMSVRGTLSTLSGSVDLSQYQLIKGLLMYNIGESLDDLPSVSTENTTTETISKQVGTSDDVWTYFSLHLDLVNVTLKLQLSHGNAWTESSLACINFIKSRLLVETFSNNTRDVDLVSQEILITDTRFQAEPVNKRSNVFTNIIQPINMAFGKDIVQAEVHHRKKPGKSKFTILLNNMRLMAILDWWEAVKDFILGGNNPEDTDTSQQASEALRQQMSATRLPDIEDASFEMKLNITDSEVVVVEDTSQWDSNAVILKSTTVISYQPHIVEKPLFCNLNHCEMFSCVLGMEEETALSIIDPVTVNMEITRRHDPIRGISDAMAVADDRVLEIQMQHLSVRLSYHDVRMFIQMLNSLPKQTRWARRQDSEVNAKPANIRYQIDKLSALGFQPEDCAKALQQCGGQLDDAALWLTQNAAPAEGSCKGPIGGVTQDSLLAVQHIQVTTGCLSICVIDDCGDADVPLLELSLSELSLGQQLGGGGTAQCVLASDYYNRVLSGWEPFIEPWQCQVHWDHSLSSGLSHTRLQVQVTSTDILSVNLTSTLVELYRNVKESWTQDYYSLASRDRVDGAGKLASSPPGYRRRSPFVPFAICNNTGSQLWFTTIISTAASISDSFRGSARALEKDDSWKLVSPGETVPFTFEGRGKARHQDTHKLRIHQLGVKVDGWQPVSPVTVDKVGVYFRHAAPGSNRSDAPQARVVFEVTFEGSARKLVTVRSALLVNNQLEQMVEVKLENNLLQSGVPMSKCLHVSPSTVVAVPLTHVMSMMWVRPLERMQSSPHGYAFCNKPISWGHVTRAGEVVEEVRQCNSNRGNTFRLCAAIRRENYPQDRPAGFPFSTVWVQPAHTVTLLPPVTVVNLLPYDLHYSVKESSGLRGRIKPGLSTAIHQVDLENSVELSFHLENFPRSGMLVIPPGATSFNAVVRLHDLQERRLYLQANVAVNRGAGIKVFVSVPFWIINKTGLPLVFRQEGVPLENAAGQFEEHEVARMVAPLIFSFADHEASPTVVARIGNGVHPEGIPQWCQHFHLQRGIQVRRLRLSLRDSRPDIMYEVGINVRPGRGRYRFTNIVTLSPRYQLHNKSSFQLQFAQRCFATTLYDPGAQATYLKAVPDCCLPFHWPRLDKEQQLCVRLVDVPNCLWSGGFLIDSNDSRHINVRDTSGKMYFLRVEVVLQGATYFIVFTDADTIPPPIRIDNYSEVPLQFYQSCVTSDNLHTPVRPRSTVPYAWDEPTMPHSITLVAPGGATAVYDMTYLEKSGDAHKGPGLTYENFIYIAFTGTFKNAGSRGESQFDPLDVESQQLVLDVQDSTRVILSRKEQGARSQLWRMTGDGHLQHEGSSPPQDPRSHRTRTSDKVLVLDIAGPAPQPLQYSSLMVRRPDKRRTSTQTWRFTEDGRLCCAHNNMCVQAKDGFFGLRQGSEAVLGPATISPSGQVPLEQAVSRQRLRPGSGFLAVKMMTDGPTGVLQISDLKEKMTYVVNTDRDWGNISSQRPPLVHDSATRTPPPDSRELQVTLELPSGVGISLVALHPPEELLFAHLKGIVLEAVSTHTRQTLGLTVQDVQIDNQLFEAQCPVLLYVTPPSAKTHKEDAHSFLPALSISLERIINQNINAENFKYLIVTMKNLTVNLEELLLLKLFAFSGYNSADPEQVDIDESDFEVQRILTEVTSVHAKKYYFEILKLEPGQVRLSVMTTSKLPPELHSIKRKLGLTLIKFEDANIDLKPFIKHHPFESGKFFVHSVIKKYKDELKWQAAFILGSVDFLGNPLGLMSDVAEGVSGLIYDGNVQSLVQNISYGLSNSAAKVTESLSDGVGRMIMDDQHEEARQRIRKVHTGGSSDHLVAGLKGLGFGLLGGVTSVFKQTYEGAANEGFQGFISGLGKGLVGTVTKPVVGVLDFASEAASAVRDSSRSAKHLSPVRFRTPRCVVGPGGLLPPYSKKQSQGQEFLHTINRGDYSELFIAYECLRSGAEDLRILISSERVRVFTVSGAGTCSVVMEAHLSDLYRCQPVNALGESIASSHSAASGDGPYYIELTIRIESAPSGVVVQQEPIKRPRVRCDSEAVAKWVCQQVNYAKGLFEERRNTLISSGDNLFEDSLL